MASDGQGCGPGFGVAVTCVSTALYKKVWTGCPMAAACRDPGGWGRLGCAQRGWRQLPGQSVPWDQPSLRAAVPYGRGLGRREPEAELGALDFLWGPRACPPACLVPAGTMGCVQTAGLLAVEGRLTVPVSPRGLDARVDVHLQRFIAECLPLAAVWTALGAVRPSDTGRRPQRSRAEPQSRDKAAAAASRLLAAGETRRSWSRGTSSRV